MTRHKPNGCPHAAEEGITRVSTKYRKIAMVTATFAAATIMLSACSADSATDNGDSASNSGEPTTEIESNDTGTDNAALTGAVVIDGSSTVAPNTEVAAELFGEEFPDVNVSVGVSGTGGGFEKFCNGETDISEASRPIKDDEAERCVENGIEFVELGIANDGLAVVVHPDNDFAQCLSVGEISSMWRADSPVTNWSEVRSGFPDLEISLYGPGTDSGTFDFFTEEINGESGSINTAYNDIGEDDNAAVLGVAGSAGNSAFIPLSFVEAAGDQVRAIEIENEAGDCVAPSLEAVMDASYNPLGRQLFLYPSEAALEKPEVLAFLEFYITNQSAIAETAGFIPLTDEQSTEANARLESLL